MKKLFLVAVSFIMLAGFVSCEANDQSEEAYDINAIDKEEVMEPDDRQG